MSEIKPDRISFKQVFPTGMQYLPLHIGVEYPILPEQDPDEVMKVAVEQVRQWNLNFNPSYAMAMEWAKPSESSQNENQSSQKVNSVETKESAIQSHIKTINECKTLNNLKIFEKLVQNTNDNELTLAYTKKHEELYQQRKNDTK